MHKPRIVKCSKNYYEWIIYTMNRPGKNNEQLNVKCYKKNQKKIRDDGRTKPN